MPPINDDPNAMGGDPSMGGDPNAMDGDPSMGGGDTNDMGGDPSMDDDPNEMGGDPSMDGEPNEMGGDPSMDGEPSNAENDDTMSIINQLSDTDKEAVRKYAESMLSRDETKSDGESIEMDGEQPPMMEQVIFTKKQIKKINENLLQTTDDSDCRDERKPLDKRQSKISKKSPFSQPKFS